MKDRIKQIMDNEQLSPSEFADKLQIGRAVISHILNGRNNPSLDVVTRILTKINYINPDWLLTGMGEMYKQGGTGKFSPQTEKQVQVNNFPRSGFDLFSQSNINEPNPPDKTEYRKEIIVDNPENTPEINNNQQVIYQKAPERKVSKIIIYYSDNTFETFNADNRPL